MIRKLHVLLMIAALLFSIPAMALNGDETQAQQGWARVADGAVLVDVRDPGEFAEGHAPGAINLPMGDEEAWDRFLVDHPDQPLVLYCGSGRRAGMVQQTLAKRGVTDTFNASGLDALLATDPTAAE